MIYSNLLTAFSGGILAAGFTHFAALSGAMGHGAMVFFSTFGVYNLQRISKSRSSTNRSIQLEWVANHKNPLIITSIVALVVAMILFLSGLYDIPKTLLLLLISSVFAIWYVFPIFRLPLRAIPNVKAIVVAVIWTVILIALPVVGKKSTVEMFTHTIPFFFFFLGLAIPFDIRDLNNDSEQLRTIPQQFGIKGARIFAMLLILIFHLLFAYFNVFMRYNLSFALTMCGIVLLISKVEVDRNEPYLSLLDLSMAILGIVLFMS